MKPSLSFKTRIRYQFETFSKMVISGERCDYMRQLSHKSGRECTFSELPPSVVANFRAEDGDPAAQYIFRIYGHHISVKNDRLAESILDFGTNGRIILLAYFVELSDREIADLIGSSRSKVQRDRKKLFQELEKRMKG